MLKPIDLSRRISDVGSSKVLERTPPCICRVSYSRLHGSVGGHTKAQARGLSFCCLRGNKFEFVGEYKSFGKAFFCAQRCSGRATAVKS